MIEFIYNMIWGVIVNILFENSWNKFEDFIHEYMQGLQTQKSLLEKSIKSEKVISAASQDRTISSRVLYLPNKKSSFFAKNRLFFLYSL